VFPGRACLPLPGPIQRDGWVAVLSNEDESGNVSRGSAMKATSIVISVLCAGAVVGVAIWLAVEDQARLRLADENKALGQQLDQMAGLAAENERLSNLVAQANSSQSLPGDHLKELLRLRGEVGVLRQQSKELETLREENRQARIALESSPKTQTAGVAGTTGNTNYWPRDSWAFAGYATPKAALQSYFWAANKGDVKALLSSLNIPREVAKDLENKSGIEVAARMMDEVARLRSVRVLSREVQADDTVVLTLANGMKYPTTNKAFMKRSGNEWKLEPD